jgi:hypothetical protein
VLIKHHEDTKSPEKNPEASDVAITAYVLALELEDTDPTDF